MTQSSRLLCLRLPLWTVGLFFADLALAQEPHRGALISAIDSIVEEVMEAGPAPGLAIGVARNGELLLAKGYGYANVEHRVPVTAETVFRLGSVTKQFTGVAIMQLVEQGKLRLDDRLGKFFPDYPDAGQNITVEQLIDHTSGIKNYTDISPQLWLEDFRLDLSHEQLIDLFKDLPLDFEPGRGYNYSNSAFYLAGVLIEKITGRSYTDYIAHHLFEPLGMRSSSYCDQSAIVPNRASGYDAEDGKLANTRFISMYVPGAAGAVCSTVLDLVKWHRALAQNRLLERGTWERLIRPVRLPDGRLIPYGGGLATAELEGHRKIGHGGQVNGFLALSYYYPDDDISVVVLTNGPSQIAAVEERVARVLLGLPPRTILDLALTPADLRRYEGTYRVGTDEVHVFAQDGKLRMRQGGPEAPAIPLQHQGDGLFFWGSDFSLKLQFSLHEGVAQSVLFTQVGIPIFVAERNDS